MPLLYFMQATVTKIRVDESIDGKGGNIIFQVFLGLLCHIGAGEPRPYGFFVSVFR